MQSVSQTTLDKLNTSASYSMSGGCWLEYNMNDLILMQCPILMQQL